MGGQSVNPAAEEIPVGIGKRIARIIRSNVNDMLSSVEDPAKQLDLLVSEMEDSLRQVKQLLLRSLADEKRLQRQLDEAEELAQLWHGKAQTAVDAGEDNLAREALRKKRTYEDLAKEYDTQLAEQQRAVDELRDQFRLLQQRLKEAQARKNTLANELRRRKAADRTSTSGSSTGAVLDRSAFDKFDEMADRIEGMEAEAQAYKEIQEVLGDDDKLAGDIDGLSSGRRGGRPSRSDDDVRLDVELEELRGQTSERRSRRRAEPAPEAPAEEEAPPRRRSRRREIEVPQDEPAADSKAADDTTDDDEPEGGDWGRRVEL